MRGGLLVEALECLMKPKRMHLQRNGFSDNA